MVGRKLRVGSTFEVLAEWRPVAETAVRVRIGAGHKAGELSDYPDVDAPRHGDGDLLPLGVTEASSHVEREHLDIRNGRGAVRIPRGPEDPITSVAEQLGRRAAHAGGCTRDEDNFLANHGRPPFLQELRSGTSAR